jgi:hypothetical protein
MAWLGGQASINVFGITGNDCGRENKGEQERTRFIRVME